MRPARRFAAAAGALALAAMAAPAAGAQELRLQRAPDIAAATPCTPRPAAPGPSASVREQARRLGMRADASLLAGDLVEARDLLRRAVAQDPASASLLYRLARTLEELGDDAGASDGYCRLRALDLAADVRADVDERARALADRPGAGAGGVAAERFRAGVASLDAGDAVAAEQAFTDAIAAAPRLAPAYYDRAVARLARGKVGGALDDLDRYAALAPAGLDADARRAVAVLRAGRFDPSVALGVGVVPGGGQFYTGRPTHGAFLALAAASGLYLAMESRDVFRTRTAIDPFGNPYEFQDPVATREYPRRAGGLAIVGATIIGGALEGWLYARRGRAQVDALRSRLQLRIAAAP